MHLLTHQLADLGFNVPVFWFRISGIRIRNRILRMLRQTKLIRIRWKKTTSGTPLAERTNRHKDVTFCRLIALKRMIRRSFPLTPYNGLTVNRLKLRCELNLTSHIITQTAHIVNASKSWNALNTNKLP